MWKVTGILSLLLGLSFAGFGQKLSENRYWISFTDKAGSGFSVARPEMFLSTRAIERRERQGISVNLSDLPVSNTYVDSLCKLGVEVLGTSKWFNAAIAGTEDTSLLKTISALSFVKDFSYLSALRLSSLSFAQQFYTYPGKLIPAAEQSYYGLAARQIEMINGKQLHDLDYKGDNMLIAVIDGGFFQADFFNAFDSLWLNGRIISWHDFAKPSYPDFFKSDIHGMSVLSVMASNIPGEIVGTAPEASYLLLRSEVTGSENPAEEAWWVLAAEYADSAGADIINTSLGYTTFDDSTMNYTTVDLNGRTALSTIAAEKAFSKGMIVVASAGNEGNKPWKKISCPSDGAHVLSVGAIDNFLIPAPFSSSGPSSDFRIKPDIMALGVKTTIVTSSGITGTGNGTSFSAPLVAGMTACLWQALPDRTNQEIIDAIRRSSSLYYSPDKISGYGIPDFFLAYNQLNSSPEVINKKELMIFPNPAYDIFEIRLEDPGESVISVEIVNSAGILVATITDPVILSGYIRVTEVPSLLAGVYFIFVNTPGKNYRAKLVKL